MLNKCFNCLYSVNQLNSYGSNEVYILDLQPGDSTCTLHDKQFSNSSITYVSGGDPGPVGLPPSIFMGLRNSS